MKTAAYFSVRRATVTAHGRSYPRWKVDGRINGARYRKFFESREEAEGHKAEMELKAMNETKVVRTTASHLTPEQLRDAESAIHRLGGRHTLLKAVDWFLRTYRDTLTDKSFAEVYPLFLADRLPHLRPATYQDYKSTCISFTKAYGTKKLAEITTEDVIAYLKGRGLVAKSWNSIRADLNAVFAWTEKAPRKWISGNPVKDVEKFKIVQGLPEILTTEQVRDLFKFLESYRGNPRRNLPAGCMVPYFVLATFAGIRPSINGGEITRMGKLKNRDRIVDLKAGVIRITPDIAKTKDVRQIVIQPNVAAWLARYPLDKFLIVPANAFDMLQEVRKKFAIGHDVLRHTFISMHVAKYRSMGDTALQAGNSESMIKKHYLNLVTPAEAEEFWQIVPASSMQAAEPALQPVAATASDASAQSIAA